MVKKIGPKEFSTTIKFGGGLHTRAAEDEINEREAADGQNFQLDVGNAELRPRAPFDLIGTVPNAAEIRGGGSLLKQDGTVATFFQAGNRVYKWDGVTTFTEVTDVSSVHPASATAKLRGHWRLHNFTLSDKLIVTDLALVDEVMEWDGTTNGFNVVSFTNESGSGFGAFQAKYCVVANERANYANVVSGTNLPHLFVGSEREDFTIIAATQRPGAAGINAEEAFQIPSPDLRPINGLENAFGTTIFSTEQGALFNLSGNDALDFNLESFYPRSGASGDESLAYIGTDIIYGRQGRIESVRDTDRFGDSEADDLTRQISNEVQGYTGWTTVYNSRLNRVYLFPDGVSEVWVFQTAMLNGEVSPWMKWVTTHSMAFQPTFVMSMLDPSDKLEYVFMGDSSGNIYRLEGSGTAGDSGTTNIATEFLTKLHGTNLLDAEVYNVEGYIKYRVPDSAYSVTLCVEYSGHTVFNETVTIPIPAGTGAVYYGGAAYYGGEYYYDSVGGRLKRQDFWPAGQNNDFQIRVTVDDVDSFSINEIGLRFRAASP